MNCLPVCSIEGPAEGKWRVSRPGQTSCFHLAYEDCSLRMQPSPLSPLPSSSVCSLARKPNFLYRLRHIPNSDESFHQPTFPFFFSLFFLFKKNINNVCNFVRLLLSLKADETGEILAAVITDARGIDKYFFFRIKLCFLAGEII